MEVESRMVEAGRRSVELEKAGRRLVQVEVGSQMVEVGCLSVELVEVGRRLVQVEVENRMAEAGFRSVELVDAGGRRVDAVYVLWLSLSDAVCPASDAAGKSASVAGLLVRRPLRCCSVPVRRQRCVVVVAVGANSCPARSSSACPQTPGRQAESQAGRNHSDDAGSYLVPQGLA